MCHLCDQRLYHEKMGMVGRGPFTTNSSQADPIISPHQYHWLFSQEAYAFPESRRKEIEGWVMDETINLPDMVLYKTTVFAIIAFRGSVNQADIRADIQLSKPGNNACVFDRVNPAVAVLTEFLNNNDHYVQCTGHSLGGAIAKCVGGKLDLGIVTFNTAAPPSNPVGNVYNQVNYHIVFDIISAWIPSRRIEKWYRPRAINKYLSSIPYASKLLFNVGIKPILKAHEITAFNNDIKGTIVTSEFENEVWKKWFNSMPKILQKAFLLFIQAPSLPPVP